MPTVSNDGVSLHYEVDGAGTPVVFVNEAGFGGWSWGWQHRAVAGPYRSVVWDLRGTGRSAVPDGPYELETLVDDLEAILQALDARSAHVVGAGLGGVIALQAARDSTRIETLTVIGTPARAEAVDRDALVVDRDRAALRASTESLLSSSFRADQPDVVDGIVEWRDDGDADPAGTRAQLDAASGFDATAWGYELTTPTLVVHGTADSVVPHDAGRRLAESLPRGELRSIDGSDHLPQIERSRAVNDHLLGFLADQTDDE